jgi:curved DNA-binding protein CbpA
VTSRNRNFVPRINPSCNLRALPLTPQDAFVLSRVDGYSTVDSLGQITGFGDSVVPILHKLHQFGALLEGLPEGAPATNTAPPPPRPPPPPPRPSAALPKPEATPSREQLPRSPVAPALDQESLPVRSPQAPRSSRYPLAELDEQVDIETTRKVRILEVFYSLPDLNHYELLGLPTSADKKQIKSAYFELAQEFHPDRFFRKSIGSYKQKLEEIFKRVTEAHDTLTRSVSRAEYDEDLKHRADLKARVRSSAPPAPGPGTQVTAPRAPPSGVTSSVYSGVMSQPAASRSSAPAPPRSAPPPTHSSTPPSANLPPRPASAPATTTSQAGLPPRPASTPATTTSQAGLPPRPASTPAEETPPRSVQNPRPANVPPLDRGEASGSGRFDLSMTDSHARRQALAAKLASGRFAAPSLKASTGHSEPPPPPESRNPEAASNARETLRRMQATKGITDALSQFERYAKAGEEAAARGDAVTASNAFRLALALEPENTQIKGLLAEWSAKASAAMASQYVKQGEAEASQARWPEAARSYVRAVAGMPDDPQTLARAAELLVLAEGDLHQAVEFARKAVALASKTSRFRLILAQAYLAAGLDLNARRELESALKMDPANDKVKALLKQLG